MNKIATMELNKYWGIPQPLQLTRQKHRQGRAIRSNIFNQRTMPLLKKDFRYYRLCKKTFCNKIYNFNFNDAT